MESVQKEVIDGREVIPNPATTPPPGPRQRHMVTTQAHRPIRLSLLPNLFSPACDDWSPRPHTLSSSSLWAGCGIKGERRPWWSACKHGDGLMEVVATSVSAVHGGLEIRVIRALWSFNSLPATYGRLLVD
jgi:hypothetical protein